MNSRPTFDDGTDGVDLLAAEFVLGVLDDAGRRLAQERRERDAAFAEEVSRWESWFLPWLQAIAPVEPPQSVWVGVRTTLWHNDLPSRNVHRPRALWDNLGLWRGLAGGALAAAVASIAILLFAIPQRPVPLPAPPVVVAPPPTAAPMVVSLRQDDGSTAYTATVDSARGKVILVPVHLQGDVTLSPELWLIPAGDKPHSLGMVRRGEAMLLTIPASLRAAVHREGLLAISLEATGSGPHEAPQGPVVAKGSLIQL